MMIAAIINLAGNVGYPAVGLVVMAEAAGAIAGDNLGYAIGHKGGRWLLQRPGPFARQRAHVLETGRAFAVWNAAGAITWATAIGLAAYDLGRSTAGTAALFGVAGLVGLLAIPGLWVARRRRRRAPRGGASAAPHPGPASASPILPQGLRRCGDPGRRSR